jgi:branched-chain amino acid aminotransferase
VVRLTLTAGVTAPTFCLTARARSVRAEPVRLVVASLRRPAGDPTADLKTTSRVFWELAAAEALRRGADDALVLGADGAVLETARANLFCAVGGRLCTARLDGRILPGVARAVLIENMASDGVTVEQRDLAPAELDAAEGLWVTNAVYGPLRAALVDRPAVRESDTFGRALATAWERALGGGESSRAGASDGAADRSIPTP